MPTDLTILAPFAYLFLSVTFTVFALRVLIAVRNARRD